MQAQVALEAQVAQRARDQRGHRKKRPGRKPTKEAAARARTDERRRRSLEARPQWMEHFRSRRHQRKLVERDLSRFVYCEDCDLYVENLEFETHQSQRGRARGAEPEGQSQRGRGRVAEPAGQSQRGRARGAEPGGLSQRG